MTSYKKYESAYSFICMIQKLLQACTSIFKWISSTSSFLGYNEIHNPLKTTNKIQQDVKEGLSRNQDRELLLLYLFFNTHFKPKVGLYIKTN